MSSLLIKIEIEAFEFLKKPQALAKFPHPKITNSIQPIITVLTILLNFCFQYFEKLIVRVCNEGRNLKISPRLFIPLFVIKGQLIHSLVTSFSTSKFTSQNQEKEFAKT